MTYIMFKNYMQECKKEGLEPTFEGLRKYKNKRDIMSFIETLV